ncbi:hypothetical protein A8990_105119 [Paenibacillus taihuensis]|uniref:Uncharacterized protein n=1 Tax=Paenibacillus taihuensis TaxID=1156355 RepID=A0A3D9SBY8_9BACL|nr:hypothetical protein [Paenibacillus taihuensis]REE91414.1 hypothetical protein A8990_105119 [Paenibacillus taihuensis]
MKKKLAKMVSKALNATVSKTDDAQTFKLFTGSIDIPSDKKQQEQK